MALPTPTTVAVPFVPGAFEMEITSGALDDHSAYAVTSFVSTTYFPCTRVVAFTLQLTPAGTDAGATIASGDSGAVTWKLAVTLSPA